MAEENDNFDPYKARVVPAPVSNWGTTLHFLKGSIGTGILAMPKGFAYTGLITGSIATFFIGTICSYGLNLLMSTEYILCKRKRVAHLNYADAMEYAIENGPKGGRCFAKASGILVNVFLLSYQIGICCVYMIFVSTNVKKIVDMKYPDNGIDVRVYMCIFFVLFLLINYVPDLQKMAPLSGVANVLMIVGLGVILYYVFQDLPPITERSIHGEPRKWIMFIGICLFAIESVGVVVSAEFSMENPQDFGGFCGVLNISLMIVTCMYWFLGFFGYWQYNHCAEGSITLNLPVNDYSAATQGLFAAALVISYGLQCYPAIEIVWNNYLLPKFEKHSKKKQMLYQYILRTFLTVLTFCLAEAFAEHLANAISFIGVVCLSMLGFAFPGLMNLCCLWPDQYGKWNWKKYKDILMILLGIFLVVAGMYVSINDIIGESLECDCKGDLVPVGTISNCTGIPQ